MKHLILFMMPVFLMAKEKPAEAPRITPEDQAAFYKLAYEAQGAQIAYEKANTAVQAKAQELAQKCGDAKLFFDNKGMPACQPKPEEKKK